MRLYILRHEERGPDYTFKSSLTPSGKYRAASSLKDKLMELNINKIYCSPFIRTLQTIEPYVYSKNITPNIEYSLCEDLGGKRFEKKSNITLTPDNMTEYRTNKEYESITDKTTINYPESKENVKKRVSVFLDYLKEKHCFVHDNILLCTHMSVCNMILNTLCDNSVKIDSQYPIGGLSLIENNTYKLLN